MCESGFFTSFQEYIELAHPEASYQRMYFRCGKYRAAILGQTKKSFIAKLSLAVEEVEECSFWIEFIIDEKLLSEKDSMNVLKEANELTAIFIASRKTAEKSLNRNTINL